MATSPARKPAVSLGTILQVVALLSVVPLVYWLAAAA